MATLLKQKIYYIPIAQRKEKYSVLDFKDLYFEYLKLNNFAEQTSPENDKTEMSKEDKLKYYTICDITPKEVKEEIGCQIFKVNYLCETYVVYNSKVFGIGLGFGGYGVVSLTTCDFDGNGKKDLIYTFSWGSGIHRSQIGIFNFSKEKEEWIDFINFNLSKGEYVADVQRRDGKTQVIGCYNKTGGNVGTKEFDKIKSELLLIPKEYNIDNADKDGYFVISKEKVKSKIEIINKFVSDSQNQKPTSITIIQYSVDGMKYYGVEDDTRVTDSSTEYYEFEFKYLKIFEENHDKLYYLFNNKKITYSGFIKSMLSSNSNDFIKHQFLCSCNN